MWSKYKYTLRKYGCLVIPCSRPQRLINVLKKSITPFDSFRRILCQGRPATGVEHRDKAQSYVKKQLTNFFMCLCSIIFFLSLPHLYAYWERKKYCMYIYLSSVCRDIASLSQWVRGLRSGLDCQQRKWFQSSSRGYSFLFRLQWRIDRRCFTSILLTILQSSDKLMYSGF